LEDTLAKVLEASIDYLASDKLKRLNNAEFLDDRAVMCRTRKS
jgi:hypothetical protein